MVWFEWDEDKAKSNQRKHGVSFEDAMHVFDDPFALCEPDRLEGGEQRWRTIGLAGEVIVLVVAHTVTEEDLDEVIRIISARRANRKERRMYEENRPQDA